MVQQDIDRWEAMGRNYTTAGMGGAAMGALLAGAGTMIQNRQRSRRRQIPPPRIPGHNVMPHPYHQWHPQAFGLGVQGMNAAPAA